MHRIVAVVILAAILAALAAILAGCASAPPKSERQVIELYLPPVKYGEEPNDEP